jgi:hypothetical protein
MSVGHSYKFYLKFKMFICDYFTRLFMQSSQQTRKTEVSFKRLIIDAGCSPKAADALWVWYDHSKMKGVASF